MMAGLEILAANDSTNIYYILVHNYVHIRSVVLNIFNKIATILYTLNVVFAKNEMHIKLKISILNYRGIECPFTRAPKRLNMRMKFLLFDDNCFLYNYL